MPAWRSKLFPALPRARQGRSGADPVDPDAGSERKRHGPGQRPQPGLGQGVGNEMRGQVPHPLVEDVDDVAGPVGRQCRGHRLHQNEGSAQVGLDMAVPAFPARRCDAVMLEYRGVVDQNRHRSQRGLRAGDENRGFRLVRQVGGERHRPPAGPLDRRRGAGRVLGRDAVVDRYRMPAPRQRLRDRPADPPRRSGDQRGPRSALRFRLVLRHRRKIARQRSSIKRTPAARSVESRFLRCRRRVRLWCSLAPMPDGE